MPGLWLEIFVVRLLINTASTDRGGGIQVALSFLNECRGIPGHEYFVFLSPNLAKQVNQSHFPGNFRFFEIEARPATRVFSFKPMSAVFSRLEAEIRPDCVLTTSGPSYWKPKAPHLLGYNLPHYIYQDSPFWKHVSFFERVQFHLKGILIRWFYRRDASEYVVQTDDVGVRLLKFLGRGTTHTVPNTCSSIYYEPVSGDRKPAVCSPKEYRLLTVSALYSHKNLEMIKKVVIELRARGYGRIRFVLTIPQEDYERVFGNAYSEVITVGPVPPVKCPSLYQECDAMFLPTLLECFSVSYPEAMAMMKPILTSDLDFAKTVCRDAALYFDPLDPVDICDRIVESMNPEVREQLIERGNRRLPSFNNAKARAEALLSICEQLCPIRSPMMHVLFIYIDVGKNFSGQAQATEFIVEGLQAQGHTCRRKCLPYLDRSGHLSKRVSGFFFFRKLLLAYAGLLFERVPSRGVIHLSLGQTRFALLRDGLALLCARFLSARNVRKAIALHGSVFASWAVDSLDARIFRWIVRGADFVTCLGDAHAAGLQRLGVPAEKIKVVPNVAEFDGIREVDCRMKHLSSSGPIEILFLSSLTDTKGYPEYLEALELISKEPGPKINAVLCGPIMMDAYRKRFHDAEQANFWIEQTIERINRSERVHVVRIPGARGEVKRRLFEAAQIFVLPTTYPVEAQPLVVLEAMAHGCAIVTTNVGELPSTVDDASAIVLSSPTPDTVKRAIAGLVEDEPLRLRLGQAALNRFKSKFDRERYVQRWTDLCRVE